MTEDNDPLAPYDTRVALDTDKGVAGELVDLVEEGVRLVPGGSLIVKTAQKLTQRGEYSFDAKQLPTYLRFMAADMGAIAANIQKLLSLENERQPDVADIAATLEAISEASRKTTNYNKRRLLRAAAMNAFNPEFYEEGIVRELLAAIEDLEYGDVVMLRRLSGSATKRPAANGYLACVLPAQLGGPDGYHLKRILRDELVVRGGSKTVAGNAVITYSLSWFAQRFLRFVAEPLPEN